MKHILLRNVVAPIPAIVAGLLAAYAVDPDTANQIGVGVAATVALVADWAFRKYITKEVD